MLYIFHQFNQTNQQAINFKREMKTKRESYLRHSRTQGSKQLNCLERKLEISKSILPHEIFQSNRSRIQEFSEYQNPETTIKKKGVPANR